MASITWGDADFKTTLDITAPAGITVNSEAFTIPTPTIKAKWIAGAESYKKRLGLGCSYSGTAWVDGGNAQRPVLLRGSTVLARWSAYSNTYVAKNTATQLTWKSAGGRTINTNTLFTASNKTSRTATLILQAQTYCSVYGYQAEDKANWGSSNQGNKTLATYTITLNVPPTFSNDSIQIDTNYDAPYAGLSTASVAISSLKAYYSGYITKATLTIGNQTDTLTFTESSQPASTETLDILLNAVGTFTPTITVTDSRGQTKTVTLETITVKGYTAPQVIVNSLERTDENGTANDEGECAVVTATFNWTSAITDLTAPTLVAKDLDDTTVSTTTTWYTDRALQNAISDWSAVTTMPVYAFIGNSNTPPDPFDTQDSYNITVTPNDGEGAGTPVTATLGSAFYTMDFLAGGHGIAFGKPAETQELFECDLNAQFNKQVLALNYFMQLDTTAQSGVDHDIYTALQTLGWDSDVIV